MSIHRFIESSATNRAPAHCSADLELQAGLDVGQEQHVGRARAWSDSLGSKCSNTLSWVSSVSRVLRSQSYLPFQKNVLPPVTRSTSSIEDPRVEQDVELGLAEVVADRPDDPHVVEERGGQREVGGRAAEHPLADAERRLHGVKGDRTDDGDAHGRGNLVDRRAA